MAVEIHVRDAFLAALLLTGRTLRSQFEISGGSEIRSSLFLAVDATPLIAMACGHATQARQSYQNGVPFLMDNFGAAEISLSYDVFDFGKRRAAVRERERVAENQLTRGVALVLARRQASVASHKGPAELLQSQLAGR